ncbi:MAG: SDR family NAD(P)-dependent oxidoreductase, partial [Cyanobacteria bacterium P01_A01_bin.40]
LLKTLGQLWLAGVEVDWSGFYADEQRHRIPLPTYPFERQRYWIEPPQQGKNKHLTPKSLGKKLDITDWFYIPFWKPSVLEAPAKPEALTLPKFCTLVFIDECGLGGKLLPKLQTQNQNVIIVKVGDKFTQVSESLYTLNPKESNDYHSLLTELVAQQKTPDTIIHLWNITFVTQEQSRLADVEKSQEIGFYSLLFLAQEIGKQNLSQQLQITVISNNMQSVTGEERLSPTKATLLGPVKVIPQEYPNINCRSIDVVLPIAESWQQEKLIEQLLTELRSPISEQLIAYRGHNRWLQSFEPVQLKPSLEEAPRLREAGVYLITGGLGGIGLVLAKHLAKTVRAKLILIGRSAFPTRQEWDSWLATHQESDRISGKIRKVQELEDLGAEVLIIKADVTNFEQMQAVVAQIHSQFGQLHGLIHAAGVPGGGVIQRKTQEEAEKILDPKVKGTLVLDAILKNVELDFSILTSSITSMLGEFGQVDYAGANAFLDAFANYKTFQQNSFIASINWGAWQKVGMATDTVRPKELQKWHTEDLQQQGILPKEGIDALMRLLENRLSQVIVSPTDFLSLLEQHNTDNKILSQLEKENVSKSKYPRPELSSIYVTPRNETEQKLVDIWRNLLGIEKVGIHDNFFELGGDSLLSIQMTLKAKQTGLRLTPNQPFEYPTIADLAAVAETFQIVEEDLDTENINYSHSSQIEDSRSLGFPRANLTDTELEKFLTKIDRKNKQLSSDL